jgi:hypothetical protein
MVINIKSLIAFPNISNWRLLQLILGSSSTCYRAMLLWVFHLHMNNSFDSNC